ncbi:hypothetical protein Anapl_09537 [Anas platyrhynchos]|uniref:Uncharacterized protein n=1 Tax=Anas platyrhynchos TaxID=8839 RepID=R0KM59_ANAPL|nr:hypothetical protein Anapl_09537 [Anas platyrhynchos]
MLPGGGQTGDDPMQHVDNGGSVRHVDLLFVPRVVLATLDIDFNTLGTYSLILGLLVVVQSMGLPERYPLLSTSSTQVCEGPDPAVIGVFHESCELLNAPHNVKHLSSSPGRSLAEIGKEVLKRSIKAYKWPFKNTAIPAELSLGACKEATGANQSLPETHCSCRSWEWSVNQPWSDHLHHQLKGWPVTDGTFSCLPSRCQLAAEEHRLHFPLPADDGDVSGFHGFSSSIPILLRAWVRQQPAHSIHGFIGQLYNTSRSFIFFCLSIYIKPKRADKAVTNQQAV